MKQILIAVMFYCTMQVAFAQQTPPGQPIDPVTTQKQNVNEMAWDNSRLSAVQFSELPASVNTAFISRYPNQSDVTWYRYQNGYIASYNDNNKINQRVVYDMNGAPVYMGKQIRSSTLPATTTTYLKSNYPNTTYDNVYEVMTPSGEKTYQVWVDGTWVKFDKNGNMVPVK